MEKIVSISKSKEIDYSQERLTNFWLGNAHPPVAEDGPTPSARLAAFLHQCAPDAAVVCIASAELSSPEVVKRCLSLAERGVRVYLLTAVKPAEASQLAGNCLMRFDLPYRGSLVLVNPQNDPKGLFLDCSLTDAALGEKRHQAVEMDDEQAREAYAFFAHHFWYTAKQEIVDRHAKATACKPAGFSVQQPAHKVEACAALFSKGVVRLAAVPSSQWKLEAVDDATLMTDIQVKQVEQVGAANRLHINLQAVTPHCVCAAEEGYLFVHGPFAAADVHYTLRLNHAQLGYYSDLITRLAERSDYAFVQEALRGNLIGRRIRRLGAEQDRVIAERNSDDLPVSAKSFLSHSELSALQPPFVDDEVTCWLTYRWTISPYCLPKGATEDGLYQRWKTKESDFQKQVADAGKTIDKANEKSKSIAGGLMRFLKQVVLGKSQQWQELASELRVYAGMELSTKSPGERKKIVDRFNAIQNEVAATLVELDQKVEEAKQQEEWESKRSTLVNEISQLEQQIAAVEEDMRQQETAFTTEQATLRARFEEWLKLSGIKEEDILKLRGQWEQASGKKQREKDPKAAKEAQIFLQELEKLDPSVLARRHATDMKGLEQHRHQYATRLQKKKADLEKMGSVFKPNRQSTGGSLIDSLQGKGSSASGNYRAFADDFPEDLPKVGSLYSLGGKRYLAIGYWSEEETGRREAERLKAILCATPEN